MCRACSTKGGKRNAYRILVGKAEGKRSSGSEYGPVEGSCEHDKEPSGSIKFWEVLE
jgi:hypothetical protein